MSNTLPEATVAPPRSHTNAKWILTLLFIGNLLNFYDRQLPSIVLEQIKAEFMLDDAQVGLLASAFVLVGAIAGIPLGMLADRFARKWVAGVGMFVWSAFTAAGGLLTTFWGFFGSRVGVGIGEAAYGPATGSLIADLYPSERRSRANALFSLGFPLGLLLAFLTVGGIAEAFGSWRAPFLLAAVPGVIVAVLLVLVREPRRGESDRAARSALASEGAITPSSKPSIVSRRSLAAVFRVRSIYGIMIAFAGYNFAAYSVGTFLVPVLQRYYGLGLVPAALLSGLIIGVTGLIGLLIGGRVLDRASQRSASRRVMFSGFSLVLAAVLSFIGLTAGQSSLWQLVVFLGLGYLFGIIYLAAYVPAVTDVVAPKIRSTALGTVYAVALLLGGAGGPIVTGIISDAINASSASTLAPDAAAAQGLQSAMMIIVPLGFAIAALGMFLAARSTNADRARMLSESVDLGA